MWQQRFTFVLGFVFASFLTLSQPRSAGAAAVVNAPRSPAPATAPPGASPSGATAAPGALQPGGGWVPDGKGGGLYLPNGLRVQPPVVPSVVNGISYHGGPVMLGTTHVYYVWYGNWSSNTATTILADFAKNLGGSPYFNINTGYSDGSNHSISNSVTFGGAAFDAYSQGATINDAKVLAIVETAINNHSLPLDHQGVYFVLTSADVVESDGFCTVFCGWHSFATLSSVTFQYGFIGNGDQCPNACREFPGNDPNGNSGADGMASIIAHETDESVTDPQIDAWSDDNSGGQENGDKCNFTFGPNLYLTANGSIANIRLGQRDYLIQEDWVNASGGFCAMALAQPTSFFTLTPCRLIDTRNPVGPLGGPALAASQARVFALAGAAGCGVPSTARALAVNVTVTQTASSGYLAIFAADQQPQGTSDISFKTGRTVANNAVLRLSGEGSGSLSVFAGSAGSLHFILDVVGYFQ
jgi:hypothetical protein